MKTKEEKTLAFTHVKSVKNEKRLKTYRNYSPDWLVPELPQSDPLYGLDLRVVIAQWQTLYRKLKERCAEQEAELTRLKSQPRSWGTRVKAFLNFIPPINATHR
jgi:hypothetical protein